MALLIQFNDYTQVYQTQLRPNCVPGEKLDLIFTNLKKSLCLGGTETIRLDNQTKNNRLHLTFTAQVDKQSQLLYHFWLTHSLLIRSRITLVQKHNYLVVRSSQIRKNACKTIAFINALPKKTPVFLMLSPFTGYLEYLHSTYLGHDQQKQKIAANLKTAITECLIFSKTFNSLLLYKCNIINKISLTLNHSQRIRPYIFGQAGQLSKLQSIRQRVSLSNLKITNSLKETRNSKFDCEYHESINIQKVLQMYYNRVLPHQIILYSQSSYSIRPKLQRQEPENFQAQMLSYKPKPSSNFDNNHVFSTIFLEQEVNASNKQQYIAQSSKVRLQLLRAKIKYGFTHLSNDTKYLCSEQALKEQLKFQNFLGPAASRTIDKTLVVKIPNPKLSPDLKNRVLEMINHQKVVLRSLRGAQCIYLPKYYQTTQTNSQYREFLLIDYISGPTLADFQMKNLACKSHSWKLALLMHLANALRFLQAYDIVHLDLSVNNIIVTKEGIPKIIDFGEAYHQQTIQKFKKHKNNFHSSGRTFPFAPPETTQRTWNFSCKQDIFSLGIIAFRLIMGYFPNSCSQTKLQELYLRGNYRKSIFFSPEGIEWVGEMDLMLCCMQLILGCLHNNQNMRPYPSWSHLVFKKIFQTIQQASFG